VQADDFAPFYDFALRGDEIELKEGIWRNFLFLLLGGREGIERIARGYKLRHLLARY
jgi:hypothetical protein